MNRYAKFLVIPMLILLTKALVFGWWHYGSAREMIAEVILPIIVHMLGGLGAVFLAWWLIDDELRQSAKREEWEKLLAFTMSDLRRNAWLVRELQKKEAAMSESKVYARYWMEGLRQLQVKLPKSQSSFANELWMLIHRFDQSNQMLDEGAVAMASHEAQAVEQGIRKLEHHLHQLVADLSSLKLEPIVFEELFHEPLEQATPTSVAVV